MSGPIKKVGPFTQSVRTENSRLSDAWIPTWDRDPGPEQHRGRIVSRAAMGQKMTPKPDAKNRKR